MASISKCHRELVDGVGKCSVPMWCNGMPAGFCDEPAYGEQLSYEYFTSTTGERRRLDGGYAGYVPALACPGHGGPKERLPVPGVGWND